MIIPDPRKNKEMMRKTHQTNQSGGTAATTKRGIQDENNQQSDALFPKMSSRNKNLNATAMGFQPSKQKSTKLTGIDSLFLQTNSGDSLSPLKKQTAKKASNLGKT
jgi:hypothetical protein